MLLQALQEPPPDGGKWNGRKVADWMSELLERPIHRQRGWDYLKAMEYRRRVPRPHNPDADANFIGGLLCLLLNMGKHPYLI